MSVTSNEILQNIQVSINTALQRTDLTEDQRGALIEQYDRTVEMIKKGYENIDVSLDNLSDTIRNEAIALVNAVTDTFNNISSELLTTLEDNANTLNTTLNDNVSTALSTLDTDSQQLIADLTNASNALNQSLSDDVASFKNTIVSRVGYGNNDMSRISLPIAFSLVNSTHQFLHLKTNIPVADSMDFFSIKGGMYGFNIDSIISLYANMHNKAIRNSESSTVDAYSSTDGFLVLKISHPSPKSHLGLMIEHISHHNGFTEQLSIVEFVANTIVDNQF